MILASDEFNAKNSISPPLASKHDDHYSITFLITGYIIKFYIEYTDSVLLDIKPGVLKENGNLPVPIITGNFATDFFLRFHNVKEFISESRSL